MLTDKEIDDAAKQLADYRRNDKLEAILNNYALLLEEHQRLKSDYEEERDARERYKQLARGQERNPFVLVLIDADGYVFDDRLVGAGAEGGSRAAQLLNDGIKTSLRRKGLEHCDIVVRAYANVAGLSKALSKSGLLGAEKRSLAPFIAHFNRSYPLTDFVDAGELKENADFKLRGLLRLYAENAQCKHIYFAACHDAGYVSELTQYRDHSDRVTLIKTPGLLFHDEFTKLGLGIEELPGVFRPAGSAMDAIYPKPLQTISSFNKSTPSLPSPSSAATSAEICSFYKLGKCRYGSNCKKLHANPQSMTTTTSTLPVRSMHARDSPHRTYMQQADLLRQLPRKEDIPPGHVAVNKNGQRLDYYLSPPTPDAENRLRARSATTRLCNAMHLKGSCSTPGCEYDHSQVEEDLKPALEWLARSLPCAKRGDCRNAACLSGHVCLKPDCKHYGSGKAYCKIGFLTHLTDLAVDRYVPATTGQQPSNGDPVNHTSPSSTVTSPVTEDDEDEGGSNTPLGGTSI
ncbi:hypothetical protein M406DRAFT_53057 [Cryphonectria parasitica EP155]|uniref:C3H1-type domain-containing protein n=1 Tax=Cryphonectria parasitica (strain ATCC 38755 / EP155) TaxID=660469 RepID=A0A9P5CJV9_CRYP1|nr:uncharacterized protein M406DRAFT_53057 [Cryphonectria parasitica EP155]KAF3760326.1 hypothetical protein M406DRAFT_53057 [Cryphonectria parasitica EP155]